MSTDLLWLNNSYSPAWVDSQNVILERRALGLVCTSDVWLSGRVGPYERDLEVAVCRELCEDGKVTEAVDGLNILVQQGCHIPNNLFYRVLKRCILHKDLVLGRRVHALSVASGYESNAFLANHLICMYASHGNLVEAMHVFSKVSVPDAYMWASIILAYAKHGHPTLAIGLYQQMRGSTIQPDNCVFVAVLKACASVGHLAVGKHVHDHIRACGGKPDIFVQTCLVDMYAKCGSLEDARAVFDSLCEKDVVAWNAMIAGYAQQGMGEKALCLYRRMQQEGQTRPSRVTFLCLLQACAALGVEALHHGKQLHAQIEEQGVQADVAVGNSLINMYAKCGSLEDARRVFDVLHDRDIVTWTAMIAGYVQQGMGQEALRLHSCMEQGTTTPHDSVIFASLLQACASAGTSGLQQGKQLHRQIDGWGLHADVVVGNSLVNMYAKCGRLDSARKVFDRLRCRDVVTWNVMIAGYAQQGLCEEALRVFVSMQEEGTRTTPNAVTFVCLVQACAVAAALPMGKQLHAQIIKTGFLADTVVGSSLVNMYVKCGSLEDARQVFDSLPERHPVAWGALIAGYSRQGESEVVFDLVDRMMQEGIRPSGITFLCLLSVCSYVGLVDEGRKYFRAMSTDFGIAPTNEHYSCMMGLLGRAGHLDEALQMGTTMPFQPNSAVWISLLSACRKWSNVEVGQQAFQFAVSLDENDAAPYILMSNIYASAQMWKEVKEMQASRWKLGAWKQPGQSWWTDMDGVMHSFVV